MKRLFSLYCLSLITFFTSLCAVHAEEFILSVDSEDDSYFATLLEAALEAADGDHTFRTYGYQRTIPQSRILRLLLTGDSPINVVFTGHSVQRENLLRQIDIPLLRGLLGYRLFAIHKEDEALFASMGSLEDLTNTIHVGSGTSWPDTFILKAAGFHLEMGTVDNLWRMLERNRFKALPMGMSEIYDELARFKQSTPASTLMVEKSIMLQYHFDHFFYVAPSDSRRATIIEQGLKRLYETGDFMRIFNEEPMIKAALQEAKRYKRKIIKLDNPLNSDRIKAIPAHYWHNLSGGTDERSAATEGN